MFPITIDLESPSIALVELLNAIVVKYWWVFTLILFAWYLRWYRITIKQGQDRPALTALIAMGKHSTYALRGLTKTSIALGLILLGILTWMFDILPMLAWGLATGDPVTWAVAVASSVASTAAFDWEMGNPVTMFYGFIITFLMLILLKQLSGYAQEETEDAGEGGRYTGKGEGYDPLGLRGR